MLSVKFAEHRWCLAGILLVLLTGKVWALDAASLNTLATGEANKKIALVEQLVNAGDAAALPVLEALSAGTLYTTEGEAIVIVTPAAVLDALTGKPASVAPLEKISINNRLRQHLNTAIAALRLVAPERALRLAAAMELQKNAGDALLPLIERRLQQEEDAEIKSLLLNVQAGLRLRAPERELRLKAIQDVAQNPSNHVKSLLVARLENGAGGNPVEPDAEVRRAIQSALASMDAKLKKVEYLGHLFSGLSLGSILLLAALGLAITFGLMGIINMAHGELLMIGAYATYVVQILFKQYWPTAFESYLLAAVPVSFVVAGLVGMAMERSVIRYLYGRPLETLLATWGISLLLIQTVRLGFGAQNVAVDNPAWMSGAWSPMAGLVLPYNRIAIIVFALLVVTLMWFLLTRTRLGLYLRAVTQNRSMASCMGIPAPKVDILTFGLGSGIAGLGGCALSQVGNVGPELGQGYIVDSFMVVVLGGVGQLAGTVVAALGLGEINKLLEPYAGAVLGKIIILVMIIIFIQKRPQGLFALKGRSAES